MKVLELFSGTGSVGKCCKRLGWEVVSVDMILPADHKCDIMDFNYKQYDKNEFDVIWASPPCTNYSKLQDCWFGRMRKGEIYSKEIQEKEMNYDDKLVLKTLEIIDESVTNDHHLLSNGKSNFDTQRGFLFHPELKELCNDIQHHIHKFSTLLGTFPIHLANSWFNIMSPNGVVHPHRHEGSVVSGAYYIRAPEGSSSLHFSSPLKPLRMNEITQHVNPLNLAEKSMPIKEDLMILFPSWLEHFTNENDNTKRTVISFNTEYLKRDSRI